MSSASVSQVFARQVRTWRGGLVVRMQSVDLAEAVFSVKSWLAAMLAYYAAAQIGLPRPFWALTTCYLVSQPLAGATLSKAAFRLAGTVLGATAAIVLVGSFVNEPTVLSLAMAAWLGLCVYMVLLDRTPRSYVFLLAGYTACIIGFPAVNTPEQVFQTGILRVQEISIGISCSALVHGLIAPRTVTAQLLDRIEQTLTDAERWSRLSLVGRREVELDRERRRLAADVAEAHLASTHLPFDVARVVPPMRALHALQDQISLILPLAGTVEDRVAELLKLQSEAPTQVSDLLAKVAAWLDDGGKSVGWVDRGARIADEIGAVRDALPPAARWVDMLELNLLSRLAELVKGHCACRQLQRFANAPAKSTAPEAVRTLLAQTPGRSTHRDRGLALRAAISAATTIALGCAFWIATAWPDGAQALLIAAVAYSLFANIDDPAPAATRFLAGFAGGVLIATIYAFGVLPRVTDLVTLAAVTAPPLLLLGSMLARPAIAYYSLGGVVAFPSLVGFNLSYSPDFAAFANVAVAQVLGVVFAVAMLRLIGTVGVQRTAARLLAAMRQDVAYRARGLSPNRDQWIGRMVDRLALVIPRLLASSREGAEDRIREAFGYLRTGMAAGDLRSYVRSLPDAEASRLRLFLDILAQRYGRRSPPADEQTLLAHLDSALLGMSASPRPGARNATAHLVSLRRTLFPTAAPPLAPGDAFALRKALR